MVLPFSASTRLMIVRGGGSIGVERVDIVLGSWIRVLLRFGFVFVFVFVLYLFYICFVFGFVLLIKLCFGIDTKFSKKTKFITRFLTRFTAKFPFDSFDSPRISRYFSMAIHFLWIFLGETWYSPEPRDYPSLYWKRYFYIG